MCKTIYGVGYLGYSTTGEMFIVIKYEGRKNITIQFSCGKTRNTTSTHIKHNRVLYKTQRRGVISVGDKFKTSYGDYVEIVLVKPKRRYRVKFPCGLEKDYSHGSLISGSMNTKTNTEVGDRYMTNNFGEVTVLEYGDAHNVKVQFKDGSTTTVQASSLRLGNVGHPTFGILIGDTFTNSDNIQGTVCKIVEEKNIHVRWEDGVVTENHRSGCIRKGSVYYPNAKTVTGVGYFGIGKYKPNKSGKNINYNPVVYRKWMHMLSRCYNKEEQKKPSCKAYIGVEVCEEWHNFQNFALWAEDKIDKFVDGFELDKDMFGSGEIYLPEYCTLLPDKVNGFLSDNYSAKTSGLPEGVNVIKPKTKNSKIGYCSRCHVNGVREYLGYYNTPEEAGEVYRVTKEKEARRLAEEYKSVLSEREYLKLKSFTLNDIHRKQGASQ